MKAPKILPWIARRAGIDDHLALHLWRRGAGEAEEMSGCCDSSDYYRLAISRFNELADEEGETRATRALPARPPIIPGMSWMMVEQNRFWQVNLLAAQEACRFWLSNLKGLYSGPGAGFLNMPMIASAHANSWAGSVPGNAGTR
jgi:hypothetical protein